jgi:predicted nucleotidyltransferase
VETKVGLAKEAIAPILERLKAGLQELYAPKLRRLILFGSCAREEAEPDPDIDVAVVLDDCESDFDEVRRTGELAASISPEHDTVTALLHLRGSQLRAVNQGVPKLYDAT